MTPVYVQQNKSDIVLQGTLLQWLPNTYDGFIVGTGGDNVRYEFPNAKIIGVRGYKTLNNIANNVEFGVIGDPGLILNKVFPKKVKKKYPLGIVPHFVDYNHKIIYEWIKRFGDHCIVINVKEKPHKVIENIKSCERVLSSSLHGLIVCDAFGIPNRRFVIRETMPTEFYDYKFEDYYSSISSVDDPVVVDGKEDIDYLIKSTHLNNNDAVVALQQKLHNIFSNLSKIMHSA
jgi:pyruvyltransferase